MEEKPANLSTPDQIYKSKQSPEKQEELSTSGEETVLSECPFSKDDGLEGPQLAQGAETQGLPG